MRFLGSLALVLLLAGCGRGEASPVARFDGRVDPDADRTGFAGAPYADGGFH